MGLEGSSSKAVDLLKGCSTIKNLTAVTVGHRYGKKTCGENKL